MDRKRKSRNPGKPFPAGVHLSFKPVNTGGEALQAIAGQLLKAMEKNEHGAKKGNNPEFLHNYRVALRKMRAAFSVLKGAFPDQAIQKLRNGLSSLGETTNSLRDIDVFLCRKKHCLSVLPEKLHPGVESFFNSLEEKRRSEFSKFLNNLKPMGCKSLSLSLKNIRRVVISCDAPLSDLPVSEFVKDIASSRFEIIVDEISRLKKRSSDRKLHRLRIKCKKMRYLLEFFQSLYDRREISFLIGKFKKLQNILGKYNDLVIQQGYLEEFLERLRKDHRGKDLPAASAGALVGIICIEKKNLKNDIFDSLASFQKPGKLGRCRKILKSL